MVRVLVVSVSENVYISPVYLCFFFFFSNVYFPFCIFVFFLSLRLNLLFDKAHRYMCRTNIGVGFGFSVLRHFQQYFSYIVAVTEIGRKPDTRIMEANIQIVITNNSMSRKRKLEPFLAPNHCTQKRPPHITLVI